MYISPHSQIKNSENFLDLFETFYRTNDSYQELQQWNVHTLTYNHQFSWAWAYVTWVHKLYAFNILYLQPNLRQLLELWFSLTISHYVSPLRINISKRCVCVLHLAARINKLKLIICYVLLLATKLQIVLYEQNHVTLQQFTSHYEISYLSCHFTWETD